MFDRIKKAIHKPEDGAAAPVASAAPGAIAAWAVSQRLSYAAEPGSDGFGIGGDIDGHAWRLECTAPSREFIRGRELRARADVDANAEAAIMVMNRPLKEALETRAYSLYTDNLQTTMGTSLPEEMRWLAMFEEVGWSSAPDEFWRSYAVVADLREHGQLWVTPEVVAALMDWPAGAAAQAQTPLILMLLRGKVYLRQEYSPAQLPTLAYATGVLKAASASALRNLPAVDLPL
ncbi:hypothetical protein PY257_04215 [Ramlibacter sp. H39-3-26]|uniref:hypothetical protein n=1 Tax=Curvibacter soli TaxID=3031331 RepID=UPI0023DBC065|nr:hypothetical protein [Ramlibacter sp. H39-3-26]MDF1484390.1 hypothetical protein [Ramlibacter sp. H39-3-26]